MAKATKEHTTLKNTLNREFKQDILGKVLLTDITFLTYNNGKRAYLSAIKDASTGIILNKVCIIQVQLLVKNCELGQSISRRGNCWDNAPMESFFGHFKDECYYEECETFEELIEEINDYMDYYNNYRCQLELKKMTPVQYGNHLNQIAA